MPHSDSNQKLAPLYAAGQAVIATFDLEEVLTRLVSTVQKHFKLKHIAVLLEDEKTGSLQTRKSIGWSGAGLKALSGGVGLIAAAAEQGRPVYAPDVKKDSRYVATISSTRSEVALPLLANDELVGIVDCQSEKVNFFNASKMQDLKMFAAQAAIGIRNARMFTSKERKAAQLEAINLIARQTTAVLDLSELLDKVCNLVLQAFPVDHAAILLLDESKLVFRAHRGTLTPRFPEGASLSSDEGLCGKSLAMGRPVLENDVSSAFEYIEGFAETRSEVCVPLISFGQSVGVLTLESKKPGAFDENDLASMEAVADICANAIQNARYLEKVRHMAYVDGLTGLFNRRYFENRIEEEIERAKRYQGSMAIIMVDIDHFKRLNDEYGHLLGDDVLRQVSTIFGINLRKADVACRFGGEEFALIVPQTTGDDAFAVADKLRRMIAATTFPGVARPVTVTAGVASFPQNGSTRDELVRAADAALYAGKQSGRNTVISFSSILK